MTQVFLDTSGLVAVINADDQWHGRADPVWRDLVAHRTPLVTTSLVLIEIGDGLSRVNLRPLAIKLYDRIHASPNIDVLTVTPDVESRAWELFRQRPDKEWGMTDCVSISVMSDLGVTRVFTTDYHFSQAGFEVLLPLA